MKNELTDPQKRLYNSIKTNGWFSCEDIDFDTKNKLAKCQKMADKGFLKERSFPVPGGAVSIEY